MSEPTLEELRPREWQVMWEYPADSAHLGGRWFVTERAWPDEESAVLHARALDAMGVATGEIRKIEVHSRMTKLDAGEWIEVLLWREDDQ